MLDDFDDIAETVVSNIHHKTASSRLVREMADAFWNNPEAHRDPDIILTQGAADEYVEEIHLKEIATALEGNYEIAQKVLANIKIRMRRFTDQFLEHLQSCGDPDQDHTANIERILAQKTHEISVEEIKRALQRASH
jgi:hypothetical protein